MASLPRVILVGGAPLSGKTCLAQALASRLEISHVSTDDLSTAIRAVTNAETHPALHHLDVDGQYRDYYPAHTPERLLEDAVAFHRAAWPAIEAVAIAHATWDRPALIEGWGILPEFVVGLGQEKMGAVFLVPDEDVFEHRCRGNPDFYEGASDEEGLIQSFSRRSALFSRMLETTAKEHGLPILRTTQQTSLEENLDRALSLLGSGDQLPA
jgi:2-phosphoglycerate kinase